MKKSLKEVQPFIEAYEREHNGGSNKRQNTQVVSKKKRNNLSKSNNVPLKVEDNFNFIGRTLFSLQ